MFGLDFLAAAKYPNEAIKNHPSGWAFGTFATTFSDAYPVVDKLLSKGKCPRVRIQLLWKDDHNYTKADVPQIKKLAQKYNKLAKKYPNVIIELSPCCEHNLNDPDTYLNITQMSAPNCMMVNTPWKGALSKVYKNELHGVLKKPSGPYNFSYDGGVPTNTDSVDSDVMLYRNAHASADIFFLWHARFNLKWGMNDKTPRPERKAFPTSEFIQSIIYLASDKGTFDIPKNWLIKSHAEKHNAADTKGDKLLIISPHKSNEIVLKRGGKVIAKLPYYGTFSGGGHRYYWNQMAYKAGKDVEVWQNNKKIGVVDPGFRGPTYHT